MGVIICNDASAQSKKHFRAIINYVVDSLILKNPTSAFEQISPPKPYILRSTTFETQLDRRAYDLIVTKLRDYNRLKDTVVLQSQKPIDLTTFLNCKKNLILSIYLPNDSLFNYRIEGIFRKRYITTPFLFDKKAVVLLR